MAPDIIVGSKYEFAKLKVKGDLIATQVPDGANLTVLLASNAISYLSLDEFRREVEEIRGKKKAEIIVTLASDGNGEVISNSNEVNNDTFTVKKGAYITILKRNRE